MRATQERNVYRSYCDAAKNTVQAFAIEGLRESEPNSRPITFHYSFDFAQQIHYPSDPIQPGPIFFRTPRKCAVFGINAEGLPKQVNYLIDEAVSCGKGANVVISLIHHFLENYGLGEKTVILNADNCSGQNKNSAMLWYLCWRIFADLHTSITISFLLAGHTKFAPDWCFGLFKQTFRRTRVSCLNDIVNCVKSSTATGINIAQLVGAEDGRVFVPIYDWVSFLSKFFFKLQGIKKFHHFSVDADAPGTVTCKEFADSPPVVKNLGRLVPTGLPKVITPVGLDQKRKQYLYNQIREFCTDATMDLVCPQPEENTTVQLHQNVLVEEAALQHVKSQGTRPGSRGCRRGQIHGQKKTHRENLDANVESSSSASFSDEEGQEQVMKKSRISGRGQGRGRGRVPLRTIQEETE